jgi:hypothetical protein
MLLHRLTLWSWEIIFSRSYLHALKIPILLLCGDSCSSNDKIVLRSNNGHPPSSKFGCQCSALFLLLGILESPCNNRSTHQVSCVPLPWTRGTRMAFGSCSHRHPDPHGRGRPRQAPTRVLFLKLGEFVCSVLVKIHFFYSSWRRVHGDGTSL